MRPRTIYRGTYDRLTTRDRRDVPTVFPFQLQAAGQPGSPSPPRLTVHHPATPLETVSGTFAGAPASVKISHDPRSCGTSEKGSRTPRIGTRRPRRLS